MVLQSLASSENNNSKRIIGVIKLCAMDLRKRISVRRLVILLVDEHGLTWIIVRHFWRNWIWKNDPCKTSN